MKFVRRDICYFITVIHKPEAEWIHLTRKSEKSRVHVNMVINRRTV